MKIYSLAVGVCCKASALTASAFATNTYVSAINLHQGSAADLNPYNLSVMPFVTRSIVGLTRVWQSLLPLFCGKTFEFAIQTWQPSLEHYYVFVQTYFLSQLRKMLILLISSFCKMCTLPTLRSRVFVCCEQYKHPRSYCWQWTHFTMVPNDQNQHFAELRQKLCLYIYVVVLLTRLPSLD